MVTLLFAESENEGGKQDLAKFVDKFLVAVAGMGSEQGKKIEISSENERRWLVDGSITPKQIISRLINSKWNLNSKENIHQVYFDLDELVTPNLQNDAVLARKYRLRATEKYLEDSTSGELNPSGKVEYELSYKTRDPRLGKLEYSVKIDREIVDSAIGLGTFDEVKKTRYEFTKYGTTIVFDILSHPYQISFIEIEYPSPEIQDESETPNIIKSLLKAGKVTEVTGIKALSNSSIAKLSRFKKMGEGAKDQDWFEKQLKYQMVSAEMIRVLSNLYLTIVSHAVQE